MNRNKKGPLVVTSGEPAGIGPDLCVQLAGSDVVVVADRHLLQQRAAQLGIPLEIREWEAESGESKKQNEPLAAGHALSLIHVPLAAPVLPGRLDVSNSGYVLAMLEHAARGCQSGEFSGMVTAPVHKGIINDAGIPFTGIITSISSRPR